MKLGGVRYPWDWIKDCFNATTPVASNDLPQRACDFIVSRSIYNNEQMWKATDGQLFYSKVIGRERKEE